MRGGSGLIALVYVIVGLLVAGDHHYFRHLDTAEQILSAALAVLVWPLLLAGTNPHVNL